MSEITQVNLIDIDVSASIDISLDPTSAFDKKKVCRPAVAPTTVGPHRYTIMVPHNDRAMLSVGQASSKHINDTGITGRTDSHIHWHTLNSANACGLQTMVALGGPTTEGWKGFQGTNNLATNSGFMMVTDAHSWIEAEGQQYVLSRTHDVTLRAAGPARRVVVQADQGEIDIVAQKNAYVSAPGITLSAPATVAPDTTTNYQKDWTGSVPKTAAGKGAKSVMTVVAALTAAHDLGRKAIKTYKKLKKGNAKETEAVITDVVKWALDAYKFVGAAGKVIDLISAPAPKPGCVKVNAEKDVAVLAGSDVSLFGAMGLSAGSALWTSVSAGVSASMKGTVFCGIGGTHTAVKGYRKVEIGSDYGWVGVKAALDVDVTAEKGSAVISAADIAQLSSAKCTYITAGDKLLVGGGPDSGSGLVASADALAVGMMSGMKKKDSMAFDKDGILMSRNSHMKLSWADSSVKMESGKIEMTTGDLTLWAKSGNATVNAKMIKLG
jgi:hypothetical protein